MYQPKRSRLRRDNVIALRITEEEYEHVHRLASRAGLTNSSWAREILLDYMKLMEESEQKK